MDYVLYHHGIKGQRWGVRRFQETDGSYTNVGRERHAEQEASYDYDSSSGSKSGNSDTNKRTFKVGETKAERAKQVGKVAAGVGAAAAVGGGVYLAKKYHAKNFDKVIKSGKTMQTISRAGHDFDKTFYAATNKKDKTKYAGMYADSLRKSSMLYDDKNIYKNTLTVNKDLKVASQKNAQKVFSDLYKNDAEFREAFLKRSDQFKKTIDKAGTSKQRELLKTVNDNMFDKELKKTGYDAFNLALTGHGADDSTKMLHDKFYKKMKEAGYDAIEDLNDMKYSGYKSKNPLIVFNNDGKISASTEKLTNDYIDKQYKKAYKDMMNAETQKMGAMYVGMYSSIIAGTYSYNYIENGTLVADTNSNKKKVG